MRTKTLNEIAQEAAKYAVETLDIERALVVKQARDLTYEIREESKEL